MQTITGEIGAEVVRAVVDAAGPPARISIAVVDDAGALVAFQRMTGVPRFSADFAIAKARTAAAFGTETSGWKSSTPIDRSSPTASWPKGAISSGAAASPLWSRAPWWAHIGVSGADAHGEEDIARSAAARAGALAAGRLGEEGVRLDRDPDESEAGADEGDARPLRACRRPSRIGSLRSLGTSAPRRGTSRSNAVRPASELVTP